MSALLTVVALGHGRLELSEQLRLSWVRDIETDRFNVIALDSEVELGRVLAEAHVHVIVTFGSIDDFPVLSALPFEVRRRWIHFDGESADLAVVAEQVMSCFLGVVDASGRTSIPLVTVFTATYQTGDRIRRTYASLLNQTYSNWEWVVVDDSGPDEETFGIVSSLADGDSRIRLFRADRHCGVIGEVKRRCCGLARGAIYVELDHDDELTESCLADIVEAFERFPDAGFAYSDCAEVFESGVNATYGESFAFHFGTYRFEYYRGREYLVMNYPDINAKTVRHIVGMPNHVRAWTREAYAAAGGHSPDVHVADDFELCIRTFLTTRMVHIKRFGYIQHLGDEGENTQRQRNAEIQRLVRYFALHYENRIHERLEELGVDDFIHSGSGLDWTRSPGSAPITANYILL